MSTTMNVVTDVLLAAQCGTLWQRLRAQGPPAGAWTSFFASMTGATAAGAVRHAVPDGAPVMIGALLICDLATGAAVLAAQRAALPWRPRGARRCLASRFHVQLGAFAASALWRRDFLPALANTTLGLGWVMAMAFGAARRGRPGAAQVAAGLVLGVAIGVVYVVGRGPAAWFDHVDVAHTLMAAALLLLYRGAAAGAPIR